MSRHRIAVSKILPAVRRASGSILVVVAAAICLLAPVKVHAQDVGAQSLGSQTLTCSSDNGRRQSCPSQYNPISNVQLLKRLSGSASCTQGRSWGFDSRAVWVDAGCRAQFRVYGWSGGGNVGNSTTVRCRSMDGSFRHCPVNGWVRSAQLTQQLGNAKCDQGRTWGWDDNGVWVDRQCKGDFRVWTGGRPGGHSRIVRCESQGGSQNRCPAGGFVTGALVEQQYSGAPCVQGTTWGFDSRGIWVNRGCRADFRVWLSR